MKVSIIGAGWLGLRLAKRLSQQHLVIASKTSPAGVQLLSQCGIQGVKFKLGDDVSQAPLARLFAADCLILNIPPNRHNRDNGLYTQQMVKLINKAKAVSNVVFISTTSVYGDQKGNITEHCQTSPQTPSAKAHCQIEQCLFELFGQRATVLRLSGLVSRDRHPAHSMAGAARNGGCEAVNLIHRDDVISAIERIIEQKKWGKTFHLAANDHPSRADYYGWACQQLGLPVPVFAQPDGERSGKTIDASYTIEQLGIKLKYHSPYQMLD